MIFELWHALPLDSNYTEETNRLISNLEQRITVEDVKIDDNEGFMTCGIKINTVMDLIYIKEELEDDLVIYGIGNDVLMTKYTMAELGYS